MHKLPMLLMEFTWDNGSVMVLDGIDMLLSVCLLPLKLYINGEGAPIATTHNEYFEKI